MTATSARDRKRNQLQRARDKGLTLLTVWVPVELKEKCREAALAVAKGKAAKEGK